MPSRQSIDQSVNTAIVTSKSRKYEISTAEGTETFRAGPSVVKGSAQNSYDLRLPPRASRPSES